MQREVRMTRAYHSAQSQACKDLEHTRAASPAQAPALEELASTTCETGFLLNILILNVEGSEPASGVCCYTGHHAALVAEVESPAADGAGDGQCR